MGTREVRSYLINETDNTYSISLSDFYFCLVHNVLHNVEIMHYVEIIDSPETLTMCSRKITDFICNE